jgi:Leucine-rich repeat (LRR) protein
MLAALLVGMGYCASGVCRRRQESTSASVSPTVSPWTIQTTAPPSTAALIDFVNNITLSGRTIVATSNATNAEDLALQWLVTNHATSWRPNTTANRQRLQQRYSLATLWFSNALHGRTAHDPWYNTSNWLTGVDECQWYGVTCRDSLTVTENATDRPTTSSDNTKDDVVVHLQLDTNNLHGTIPPDLGLLNLVRLDVHNNSLSGTIPSSMSRWTNLEFLRLSNNTLTGTIPVEAVQSWTHIYFCSFHSNSLVGSMPAVICGFANLSYLIADCDLVCPCCGLCYNDR